MSDQITITITVNGTLHERAVEPRLLLSDFLRYDLGLTGTHVGCEHGVCGACTVPFDGDPGSIGRPDCGDRKCIGCSRSVRI